MRATLGIMCGLCGAKAKQEQGKGREGGQRGRRGGATRAVAT